MAGPFDKLDPLLDSPGSDCFAVTPSDSTDLTITTRGIYVGTNGNISLIAYGDTVAVVFQNVVAGSILPIRAKRILATGTTATGLVGIY